MKELAEKMAVILQWIYDDGEGGSYRPNIQEVLVSYNTAQQSVQSDGAKVRTCGCKDGAKGIHANFCLFYEPPRR